MNSNLKLKSVLIAFIIIISFGNALAQNLPLVIQCTVYSISSSYISAGSGAGQVGTISVTSQNNCTNYTISKNDSWLSFSQAGLSVTISVTANTGAARDGHVYIGGSFTVTVHQACGNYPVAPISLSVDRNNLCTNSGGNITLTLVRGAGTTTRWFSGSCGGTQIYVYDANSITIPAPTTTTDYYARWETDCSYSTCAHVQVIVYPLPNPSITSGPISVCTGSTGNVYQTQTGKTNYTWTIVGGLKTSGGSLTDNTITVTWGSSGIGHVKVNYTENGCSAVSQTDYPVTINALPTPSITSGPISACSGSSGNVYITQSGKTGYSWTVLGGSILSGGGSTNNSVTVTWGSSGTGHVKINYVDNGCSAISQTDYPVTINALPTPSITGPISVCSGSNGNVYTTQSNNTHYSWAYEGGTPVSEGGINDNTVTVLWGNSGTGHVRVNYINLGGCTAASQTDYPVTIKPLPLIVNQPVNSNVAPNQDASFSITATGSNLQYQWQSSPNGIDTWTNLTGLPAVGYQTANLTILGSTTFEDNFYHCQLTSDCGSISSNNVKIVLAFPVSSYLTGSDIPDPETRVLNTANLVGTTNGNFNITPTGGSSYSIPLELPAGVNGLAPNLSISYSSNSGFGIAGFGWQLGGLSMISRGPQTFYHDGNSNGVNLDINDRFYLDGQRLVTTNSTYGASDATYQTDNDIFTRVTPQATDSYGPAWFKAETKSGLIYEYGNIPASKQKISGYSQVLNWYVSKVSDLFGNQVNFTYIQDHGSVYPSAITYGPNIISFSYKQRRDKNISFLKGKRIEQWLLLDKIVVKYNSNVIKTYEFKQSYQGSNYNLSSILNEVNEYGLNSSMLNSTLFSYQIPGTVSISQFGGLHAYIKYSSKLIIGDFNGDGKSDFLCLPDTSKGATWTGLKVYFSDGNNDFSSSFSSSIPIVVTLLRDIRSVDLNGDGIDDIVYEYCTTPTDPTSSFYYMLCNGSSFAQPVLFASQAYSGYIGLPKNTDPSGSLKSQMSSDYNGDGINDIFLHDINGNWKIMSLGNSSGQLTSAINTLATGTESTMTADVLSGEFNGDGKAEIWSIENSGIHIYSFTGTSLNKLYSSDLVSKRIYYNLGDFNGDGKLDILLYGDVLNSIPHDWPIWQIQLSTGTGFEQHDVPQKKADLCWDNVTLGDLNGDGATDLIVTGNWEGSYLYVSMDDGTEFYSHTLDYPTYTDVISLGDFSGVGHTNIISINPHGYTLYNSVTNASFLMEKISNGLGLFSKLFYTKLSQSSTGLYNRGLGANFPISDFQGPWSVVSSVQTDNGKGSLNTKKFNYEGAKIHLQGKGFLGYAKTSTTDATTSIESGSILDYDLTYYYPKLLKSYSKTAATNDTIETSNNIWSQIILDGTNKRIFPYIHSSKQLNKLTGLFITSSAQYDNYGNPTSIVKNYSNGPVETTTTNYDNTVSSSLWLLGRPIGTTLQYTGSGPTITRSGTRIFDPGNNHLASETWFSGNNQITKTYGYNSNGTFQSLTATSNGVSRSNSCTYTADNIRIYTSTNQLSHVTTNSYDNYGRLYTQEYLGNTNTHTYDNLGRESTISSSDGNQTTIVYAWENPASDPIPALYSVQKTGIDGSQAKSWFDKLGREIRSDVKGFDGTMIYTTTAFNTKGQVESVTDPYFANGASLLNSFVYDNYGRKTSLTRPTGRNSAWVYNNNTITETTAGKSFTKTYSSDGTLSSATDAGGTINYTYCNDGKVKTITAPGGIITTMNYDIAGNQEQLVDPSAGTINYTHNGFGELTTQISPDPKSISIGYNPDGTIYQKTTPEGVSSYQYNTNKQVIYVSTPGGVNDSIWYDTLGRIIKSTKFINGSPFRTSYTYDNKGRLSTVKHPSDIIETKNYNTNGYLYSISTGGVVRWLTNGMNARQQVTSGQYWQQNGNVNATFGYDPYGYPNSTVTGTVQNNSYSFDPITGDLSWRQNNKYSNLREDFQYDNLDRLSNVSMGGLATLNMDYEIDKGGITTKSDVGTLQYNIIEKPYALGSINPGTSLTPVADQTLTYTSFGSVNSLSENNYSASLIYGSDNQRAQMTVKEGSNTILTRWYPTDSYTKETAGGVTNEYTFIGGDSYSAPIVAITQGGTTTYYNILRDYLGNITHVINATTGIVTAEYSFDAWGRMRDPSTWVNFTPGSEPALFIAGRGFTGHEHLPWFNLINMNGRVYDPLIGSFLSPDNYVQSPDLTQNFNRYGYCLNNPLKYSDPSGMQTLACKFSEDTDEFYKKMNALDAYFYWLCDGSMSFSYNGGAGGGGAGGGGGGYTGGHYGTMGSGFYDTGDYTYNTSDITGSIYNDYLSHNPADNVIYSYINVNGDWYNAYTTTITYKNPWTEGMTASIYGGGVGLAAVYYLTGTFSFNKENLRNPLIQNGGFGASLTVNGSARIFQGIDGKYYVNASATAYTPLSTIALDLNYFGSIDVLSGSKIINSYRLGAQNQNPIKFDGMQDVGVAFFTLPTAPTDDIYLRMNVGYFYNDGTSNVSPRQGTYTIQVGYRIDALSY